ncbi:hypothetical protein L6164_024220 [Bauhinia variegata]|uniref:Uncharacterized protein n=1 Tax=Bauhinia variegata TaxID=167791 RepID=A0ACB9LX52_BAUVA|nr:hypothetical protein L6164_024220 [Bauhinia variegata]
MSKKSQIHAPKDHTMQSQISSSRDQNPRDQTATELTKSKRRIPKFKLKLLDCMVNQNPKFEHQTRVRNTMVLSNSAKRTLHHCSNLTPIVSPNLKALNFKFRNLKLRRGDQ